MATDGLSPSLPMSKELPLNQNLNDLVHQNLKMILLTMPGERVDIPDFGVGIEKYLFEPLTNNTLSTIKTKIKEQINKYLPLIRLENVAIDDVLDSTGVSLSDQNYINIMISYTILPTGETTTFNMDTNGKATFPASRPTITSFGGGTISI